MRRTSELHPLLLEPGFWRERLSRRRATPPSVLLAPRSDLSDPSVEVEEFRFRAHDGRQLWGLVGRCRLHRDPRPALVRLVGPWQAPKIDTALVQGGTVEFVLQEQAGRRLEDRVLDVIDLFRVARTFEGVDPPRVRLFVPEDEDAPDELRIARELVTAGLTA